MQIFKISFKKLGEIDTFRSLPHDLWFKYNVSRAITYSQTWKLYSCTDISCVEQINMFILSHSHLFFFLRSTKAHYVDYTLLKSDVTRRDHLSVVMDPMNVGSRLVKFIVNFIGDGTVFA